MTKIRVTILLIIFLGLTLRVFRLGDFPAGFHFDEAQAGYNAFLILNTGKNINGEMMPLDVDSFGDFRPAMISYLSVPLMAVFSSNELTTRLPSALSGVILIVITYLLTNEVFNKRKIGLVAAFLVAISPFDIIFSRATTEGHVDLVFELGAIFMLVYGFKRKRIWPFILAYFFWIFGYFTYHTSRFLTPVFAVITILLCIKQFWPINRRVLLYAIFPLFVYLVFPFLFFLHSPLGQGRFNQVSIFSFPEVGRSIDELIREDGTTDPPQNVFLTRIVHNKLVGYIGDVAMRYSNFFSLQTALFSLNQPDRYFVPNVGAITVVEFVGVILALAIYLLKKYPVIAFLPLFLLLIAPIPSALTFEASPNWQRALFILPFWQIVAAWGIFNFLKLGGRKRWLIAFIVIFGLTQFSYFLHQYFIHQSARVPYARNSEMKNLGHYLFKQNNLNREILLSEHGSAYIYYLFFNHLNVFDRKTEKRGKYFSGDFQIDNIIFSKNECLNASDVLAKKFDVVVFRDYCPKPTWSKKITEFRRADGSKALEARVLDKETYNNYLKQLTLLSSVEKIILISSIERTFLK